jgi:hypothetical protein
MAERATNHMFFLVLLFSRDRISHQSVVFVAFSLFFERKVHQLAATVAGGPEPQVGFPNGVLVGDNPVIYVHI